MVSLRRPRLSARSGGGGGTRVGGDIQYDRTVNLPLIYSVDDWIERGMKFEAHSASDRIIKDQATKDAYRANPWRFGASTFELPDGGGKFYIEEKQNAVPGFPSWHGNGFSEEDDATNLPISLGKAISHFSMGTYNDLLFSGLIVEWSANAEDSVWEDPLKEHPAWITGAFVGIGIVIAIACTCGAGAAVAAAAGATAAVVAGGSAAAAGGGFAVGASVGTAIVVPVATTTGISATTVFQVIGAVGTGLSILGKVIQATAPPGSTAAQVGEGFTVAGGITSTVSGGAAGAVGATSAAGAIAPLTSAGASVVGQVSSAAGQKSVGAVFTGVGGAVEAGYNAVASSSDPATQAANIANATAPIVSTTISQVAGQVGSAASITVGTNQKISGTDLGPYLSNFSSVLPMNLSDIKIATGSKGYTGTVQSDNSFSADRVNSNDLSSWNSGPVDGSDSGGSNWKLGGGMAEAIQEYCVPQQNAKGGTYYVPMVPPESLAAYVQRRRLGASVSESLTFARKVAPYHWRWATINYGTILTVDQLAKRLDNLIDAHKKNEQTAANAQDVPDDVKQQAGLAKSGYVPPEQILIKSSVLNPTLVQKVGKILGASPKIPAPPTVKPGMTPHPPSKPAPPAPPRVSGGSEAGRVSITALVVIVGVGLTYYLTRDK